MADQNNAFKTNCIRATINIPYHLREKAQGRDKVCFHFVGEDKPTLKTILTILKECYPNVASAILDTKGNLECYLSLYLNNQNEKELNKNLENEENDISIRHKIAGG